MSRPVSERLFDLVMNADPFPACGPEMVREVEELEREVAALRDAVRIAYGATYDAAAFRAAGASPVVCRALEEER